MTLMRSLCIVLWVLVGCNEDRKAEVAPTSVGGAGSGAALWIGVPSCEHVILGKLLGESAPKSGSRIKSFPDATALWPSPNIDVCWENPDLADPAQTQKREDVRLAVKDSWEAVSKVRFQGWGQCGPTSRGIRILIEDSADGSYAKALGRKLDRRPGGMVLNFTFQNWRPKCGTDSTCFKRVAIHEFGHGLGFAHEQNRPDEPDVECRRQEQGESGTCTFCANDHKSIMSYCRADWNNGGALSTCDKTSVAYLYGANK